MSTDFMAKDAEPRYSFMGHPCTAELATRCVDNLVFFDRLYETLVVRQHTERLIAATKGAMVPSHRWPA